MTKTTMVETPMTEALSRFLDVDVARHKLITNNLANIDTPGYKSKVVLFSDLFYQNLGTTGSGDPIQVGAGTSVGSLPSLFTQGSVSSTGVATDVAIQNAGFFAIQQNGVGSYNPSGNSPGDP